MKNDSTMISKTAKEGFIKLSDEQVNRMPRSLREMKYINKDFADGIIPRKEARLIETEFAKKRGWDESHALQITDKIIQELTLKLKQNIVLKNIPSFKNALLMGVTTALSYGMNPKKILKAYSSSIKEVKANNILYEKLARAKATGKNTAVIYAKLEESLLYRMEQAGLATNTIEGVRGKGMLIDEIVGEKLPDWINTAGGNVLFNQDRATGKIATGIFSHIDTMTRYSLAQQFYSEGIPIAQAVKKANGLFSDMNQIAPVMIDLLDRYPLLPFMKWFVSSLPGIMKMTQEHPVKAIGMAAILYTVGYNLNINMSGASPIESMVDFADSAISKPSDKLNEAQFDKFGEQILRNVSAVVVPSFYTKPAWKLYQKGELGLAELWSILMPQFGADWDKLGLMPNSTKGGLQKAVELTPWIEGPSDYKTNKGNK